MFGGTTAQQPTAEPNPLDDMMRGFANMFGAGGTAVEPPGVHHAPPKPPGSNPIDGFMQGLSALLGNPTEGHGGGEGGGGGGGGGGGRKAPQGRGQGGLPHMEEWRKLRGLPDQEESHQDAQKRPGAPRTGSPTVLPQGCIRIGCCSLRRVKPSKNLVVTKVDSWSEAVALGLDKGDELVSLGMIDVNAISDEELAELILSSIQAEEKLRCQFRRTSPGKPKKDYFALWIVGGKDKDKDDEYMWEDSRLQLGAPVHMRWSDCPARESRMMGKGEFV